MAENIPLIRKLGAFIALSESELSFLASLHKRRRTFAVGSDLVHQGQPDQAAYVLDSGWACSYKLLENGQRQIVDFQIPGDFLGLRSLLLNVSDLGIVPVTDMKVTKICETDFLNALEHTPRLATAVLWAMSCDEATVVERLVNVGRRNSTERMAHFLLELGARLTLVGLGSEDGYACPLTQYLLADALGLSAVHVNRVLRQLREEGMVTFQNGFVEFVNYDQLVNFSGFEQSYMDKAGPLRY